MEYSLDEIKKAEKAYLSQRALRYLKNGKWETMELSGNGIPTIDATRAETVELRKIMKFSEFLEQKWPVK